jgi:hypothetical protein
MASASTLGTLDLSLRRDVLSLRRCKGCGREWPGYLERCRLCPAILAEPYGREIVLVVPEFARGQLPARALPAATLAFELSGVPLDEAMLRAEAEQTLAAIVDALPDDAVLRTLPNGAVVALLSAGSLWESAAAAARAAAALDRRGSLQVRAGIAVGLVDGTDPLRAAVVALAARLARAAQAGQTLAGYGAARLLDREWQFAPAGVLPRRAEDAVEQATAFLGRKPAAPTPSAFAPDHGTDLVGRSAELAALDDELARAQVGAGRWCAVVAPAGGGKSKLLRTWLGRLDDEDVRLVGAAATAFGQAPRALVDQLLEAVAAPLRGDAATDEAAAVLAAALERSAHERLLLVLIDDLHWADADSLAVLRALGEHPPARCLFVVALRSSFVAAVPWLLERARRLELPPLSRGEREELLQRLLPGKAVAPLRVRLASADHGSNPLYLEQAAAYVQEAGTAAPPPRSLHEAVLRRLELVRARIDGRGYARPSPDELAAVERTVGEWLDRLETEDYENREDIAEYLGLLEQIDAALVIAGSIAGVPQRRNRRLAAAIERFYSAGFAERAEAIERLAERDPANAAYAAARGAERALAAVRLDDASRYLELAARLTQGDARAGHLLRLGDILLARGLPTRAWRAYADALRVTDKEHTRARCQLRLGHAALVHEHAQLAACLLERALPQLPNDERLRAHCDLVVAHALSGGKAATTTALRELDQTPDVADLALLLRTRLRLTLLDAPGDGDRLAHDCVAALTLEGEPVADLAALIETTLLVLDAQPALVGPELLDEAAAAARRLALDGRAPVK